MTLAPIPRSYNILAKDPDGKREGFGGGFMEREKVVQKRHFADDTEYDEYGRKKKSARQSVDGLPASSAALNHDPPGADLDEEDEEEDDDDEGDTSKYDLLDEDDDAEAALPMSFGGSKARDDGAGAAVGAENVPDAATEAEAETDDTGNDKEEKQKPQSWDWGAPEKKVRHVMGSRSF